MVDLKQIKFNKEWLEQNLDKQLLDGLIQVSGENKIVQSVFNATNVADFINRMIACNICLVKKSDSLEAEMMKLLQNKLSGLKELGDEIKCKKDT